MSQRKAFHELKPNAGSFPVFPSFATRAAAVRTCAVRARRVLDLMVEERILLY